MNSKVAMLVVLLVAGISLAVIPADSSAAGGAHPGASAHGDGVTVVYDGTPGSERFLFQFEQEPSSSDATIVFVQDGRTEEMRLPLQKTFVFKLAPSKEQKGWDPFDYGELVIMISQKSATYTVYMDIKEGFTLSYDMNGPEVFVPFSYVNAGESIEVAKSPISSFQGKEFKAWSSGSKQYSTGDMITMTSDTTLKAVWDGAEKADADMTLVIVIVAVLIVVALAAVVILLRRRVQ